MATETGVKDSSMGSEERESLRNATATAIFLQANLEDLELLFQSIDRSPERTEMEFLQSSSAWSLISSPTQVIFQTDESSSSVQGSESSFCYDEAGYEADISSLLDDFGREDVETDSSNILVGEKNNNVAK